MPKTTQFDGSTFVAIDTIAGKETRWHINPAALAQQRAEFEADMDAATKARADQVVRDAPKPGAGR